LRVLCLQRLEKWLVMMNVYRCNDNATSSDHYRNVLSYSFAYYV
jgi:hypothetical protein